MDNGFNQCQQQPNPTFTKDLVFSIIQLLCCNQITGVISLVFVILANSAFRVGNVADYQAKTKAAKVSRIIGWILGVLIYIFVIAVYGLVIVAAIADGM